MVDQYRMVHLSAGDLLRQEMNRVGSRYGQMINNYIKEGQIIPGEITVQLIEQAMRVNGWEKKVYLIDGFPRNLNNWDKFRNMLDYLVSVQFVMFFDCSNQTMQNRVMERSKNSGRTDDNMQTLLKRQKVFVDETMPVVKKYQVMNMVEVVDANTSRE